MDIRFKYKNIIKALIVFTVYLVSLFLAYGKSLILIRYALLGAVLIYISACDIARRQIPNKAAAVIALLALLRISEGTPVYELAYGLVPPILVLFTVAAGEKILHRRLIGRGDIKLLLVLGLHYNVTEMLFIILISCIITLMALLIQKSAKKQGAAMGPMIYMGVWIISIARCYLE